MRSACERYRSNALPPRPYVAPVAAGCIGLAVSSAALMDCGWAAFSSAVAERAESEGLFPVLQALSAPVVALLVIALALTLGGAVCRRLGYLAAPWLLWLAAGAAIACVTCSIALAARWEQHAALFSAPRAALDLRVSGDCSEGLYGYAVDADVERDGALVARVRLQLARQYPRGTQIEGIFRIEELGEDDWARGRFMKGQVAEARLVHVSGATHGGDPLLALRAFLVEAIAPASSDERALIAGTVCGEATELNASEAAEYFSASGLSHLVAVSGSHLALVSSLALAALVRAGVSKRMRTFVIALLMCAYVILTGGAPSAVRSLVMVLAALLAGLGGRRPHALSGLFATAFVLLAVDPGLLFDLGFELSCVSVLFILCLGGYLRAVLEQLGLGSSLAEALALTLAAQCATVPLTVAAFGELSLVAPIANLVAGPVMSALLALGVVVVPLAKAFPALGFLFVPLDALARIALFCAEACAQLPCASVCVEAAWWHAPVLWGGAAALYAVWRVPARRTLAVACAVLCASGTFFYVYWRWMAPPSLTVLDVGQADAILVRDGSHALLVDTGEDDEVLAALARHHVHRLDAVVITHWHSDHAGGFDEIAHSMPVGEVYVAEGASSHASQNVREALAEARIGSLAELSCGDELVVGGFVCTVVWPQQASGGENNEDSLCLKVSYDQDGESLTAFLTGDAEASVTEQVAEKVGDVDVLKLGHHGSRESVSASLLGALKPEVAVASAGENNDYGHPDPACVEAVERTGALCCSTIERGDVVIEPSHEGVRVRTQKEPLNLAGESR